MFKKIVTAVISILIILGLVFAGRVILGKFMVSSGVASIDQEVVFELPEFKEAQKKLEEVNLKLQKTYREEAAKLSGDKQKILLMQIQQRLTQEQAVLFRPLFEKVEMAIANVAKKKRITVVVESKIAVFGAEDITQEVINLLKSGKSLSRPKESPKSSPIGYFDQQTVSALQVFQKADEKFFGEYQDIRKELEKRLKGIPIVEQNKITEEYNLRLASKKEEIYAPLFKLVTEVVEKTAKDKGLSLVLDKQSVMYGGVNITDEVIKAFLKEAKNLK